MFANLTGPRAGDGLSAAWARGVADELCRCRLAACPPLAILSRGPGGTVLGMARAAGAAAAGAAQPWDLTVAGDTATCRWCMTMLSAVTYFAAGDGMELTASMAGTKGWLCGELNTGTKTLSMVWGDPHGVLDEASELIRIPRYLMRKEGGAWRVEVDARTIPTIGGYL